jgi:hypothetical protein
LLENIGAEIDPIRLIRRIRNGLEIPGLKPAIIKILQDFNLQVRARKKTSYLPHALILFLKISLMEGCKEILYSDCRNLALELHEGQTNASFGNGPPFFVLLTPVNRADALTAETTCAQCGKPVFDSTTVATATTTTSSVNALSIVFLCRHVFHLSCAFPGLDGISLGRPDHVISSSSLPPGLEDLPLFSSPYSNGGLSLTKAGGGQSGSSLEGAKALRATWSRIRFAAELRASVETTCRICKDRVVE